MGAVAVEGDEDGCAGVEDEEEDEDEDEDDEAGSAGVEDEDEDDDDEEEAAAGLRSRFEARDEGGPSELLLGISKSIWSRRQSASL